MQSLILLPVMTMSPVGNIHNIEISKNILVQQINIETNGALAFNQAIDPRPNDSSVGQAEVAIFKAKQSKALAIDTYFAKRDMPLKGMGMKMVEEAEKNELDWRLLPAIAVRESTGGKFDCKRVDFNAFGWGSCKIGFDSNEHSIEIVAKNLGGNNPNTARYYANKNTKEILLAYNPPSIVKHYSSQVISIMDAIGEKDVITETANS